MIKRLYLTSFLLLITLYVSAQYTDIINSNRPGVSISAFAVGKNVLQAEGGLFYEKQEHTGLLTESNFIGADFAVRYGFFKEQLEISWDGVFQREALTDMSNLLSSDITRTNFLYNTIGVKYLVYDPYKNPKKINVYSWKANNSFTVKDLIPAVAVYAGLNLNFGNNPFWPDETSPSPKVTIATQNHLPYRLVVVTNFTYDRITTDDPVFTYIITVIHALNNGRVSFFAEHQGITSDAYGDGIFRGGGAYLIHDDFQVDASFGLNIKDTPSRFYGNLGLSYRFDFNDK